MIPAYATALIIAALAAAGYCLVLMVVKRFPLTTTLGIMALLELALLVQTVIGFVKLATTDRDVSGVTFVGYLIGALLILPLATFWGLAERRTRWGAGVLAIGCLVIPVLVVRMNQIWHG